jgi:hypothetical protein
MRRFKLSSTVIELRVSFLLRAFLSFCASDNAFLFFCGSVWLTRAPKEKVTAQQCTTYNNVLNLHAWHDPKEKVTTQ